MNSKIVVRVEQAALPPKQKKRYGMLPDGVIRKRLREEDLPDFWTADRRERFPLALRCRDGWRDRPLEQDEWLFGACPVALIWSAFPDLQILVDTTGNVTFRGLPEASETWDVFDAGLRVDPAASDKDIVDLVTEATFLALRDPLAFGVEALIGDDLYELIEIIETKDDD